MEVLWDDRHQPRISLLYSNIPHIRNSIFHLRPKNVSSNTRLSGNEDQCFLYEGCKLIAFHMSDVLTMFEYTRQIKCGNF